MRLLGSCVVSTVLIALTACGGGGGGNTDSVPTAPPAGVQIGGTVSGLAAGEQVVLLNNAGDPLAVASDGTFTFHTPVPRGGNYQVTVGTQPSSQTCSVSGPVSASNVSQNVTTLQVTCQANCRTTLTGIVTVDQSFTAAGSPYCLSASYQIPAGVNVSFGPGTELRGGGRDLVVQGTLQVNGTATDRARMVNVNVVPAGLSTSNHTITISHALIERGSLLAPNGNSGHGSFSLADSRVSDLSSYIYLVYPTGHNAIVRNVFSGVGGISYGVSSLDGPVCLEIANNHFGGTNFAIRNWAHYGTPTVRIEHNTFVSGPAGGPVFELQGRDIIDVDLANNYWSTTDAAVIASMIRDRTDDVTIAAQVTFTPFLTAPHSDTPAP